MPIIIDRSNPDVLIPLAQASGEAAARIESQRLMQAERRTRLAEQRWEHEKMERERAFRAAEAAAKRAEEAERIADERAYELKRREQELNREKGIIDAETDIAIEEAQRKRSLEEAAAERDTKIAMEREKARLELVEQQQKRLAEIESGNQRVELFNEQVAPDAFEALTDPEGSFRMSEAEANAWINGQMGVIRENGAFEWPERRATPAEEAAEAAKSHLARKPRGGKAGDNAQYLETGDIDGLLRNNATMIRDLVRYSDMEGVSDATKPPYEEIDYDEINEKLAEQIAEFREAVFWWWETADDQQKAQFFVDIRNAVFEEARKHAADRTEEAGGEVEAPTHNPEVFLSRLLPEPIMQEGEEALRLMMEADARARLKEEAERTKARIKGEPESGGSPPDIGSVESAVPTSRGVSGRGSE